MKNIKQFFTAAAAFFLLPLFSLAQDTTHVVTHYRDGQINDIYRRNSAGEKDGDYIRYSRFGKKYITGHYSNGVPIGIWQYYSSDTSGVLAQTLDFDKHKETYVDSNRVPSLICGPRYFGGTMLQNEYVTGHQQSDFTTEEKTFYKGQAFVVSFTIDNKTFKTTGISVDDPSLPESFKNKLIKIAADMPAWLPPVCKDKSEVWRFSIAVIF